MSVINGIDVGIQKHIKIVRGDIQFDKDWVTDTIAAEISAPTSTYFRRQLKMKLNPDYDAASDAVVATQKIFDKNLDSMLKATDNLSAATKRVSGNVKAAANELAQGLLKVEKQANFDRLEKYVLLLERAATAMHALSELEKTGKLDKIASALK